MFPKEAYKQNNKSLLSSQNKYFNSGIFLSSLLLIGPLIHELVHSLVLEMQGCRYNLSLEFNYFQGIHGSVEPLCHLEEPQLVIFYFSGFIAVILLSLLVNLLYKYKSIWMLGSLTTGLYLSNIIALNSHGDIYLASNASNLPEIFSPVFTLILVLAVSAPALEIWEEMFDKN